LNLRKEGPPNDLWAGGEERPRFCLKTSLLRNLAYLFPLFSRTLNHLSQHPSLVEKKRQDLLKLGFLHNLKFAVAFGHQFLLEHWLSEI